MVQTIHHNVEPISKVSTIYCNNENGYFSPLRRHRMINTSSILINYLIQYNRRHQCDVSSHKRGGSVVVGMIMALTRDCRIAWCVASCPYWMLNV